MNKIAKAQAGIIISRAIPVVSSFVRSIPSLVANAAIAGGFYDAKVNDHSKEKQQLRNQLAQQGSAKRHAMAVTAAKNFTTPRLNTAQSSDATRVARPVVVSTTRPTTLDLHRTATTRVRPIAITRTMSAAQDSTSTAAPRDTTSTAPRDTTGTANPPANGSDNRSIREKLGDMIAGRNTQNRQPKPNSDNQRHTWKKIKNGAKKPGKILVGAAAANYIDDKLGSPIKRSVAWGIQQAMPKRDTVYVDKSTNKNSTTNADLQKQQQDLVNSRMQSNMAQPQIEY